MPVPNGVILPATLQDVKVKSIPDNIFYISNFITPEEEDYLIEKINRQSPMRWTSLSRRRLQAWPRALSTNGELGKEPLPDWLEQPLISRLLNLKLSPGSSDNLFTNAPHQRPNHVLINEYEPGAGILPHRDGPAYFPLVATVSMGEHTVLDLYLQGRTEIDVDENPIPNWRVLQERRSLLITTGVMYTDAMHQIADVWQHEGCDEEGIANWDLLRDETRAQCVKKNGLLLRSETRLSATIRDVIKVKDYSKVLPGLIRQKLFRF